MKALLVIFSSLSFLETSAVTCAAGKYGLMNEVFHVAEGDYNTRYNVPFSSANAVCLESGARLATLTELVAALSRGAQWCSCGWVQDGTARFPMCVHF